MNKSFFAIIRAGGEKSKKHFARVDTGMGSPFTCVQFWNLHSHVDVYCFICAILQVQRHLQNSWLFGSTVRLKKKCPTLLF